MARIRSGDAMSRPAQRHIEPVTESDDREVIARALGKVLRLARHAAELNMTLGPCDAVEHSLADLRAAVDSVVLQVQTDLGRP
jgi:hypothetical protein